MAADENPFAPPREASESAANDANDVAWLQPATQGSRFVNLVGDTACRSGFIFASAAILGKDHVFVTIFFWLGYYVLFEWLFGKTPAKWLTGTRVVTTDGNRPRFLQIVGRSLARYVPFEPFSFFGGRHPMGWHDRWSSTMVVKDPR